MLEVQIVGRVEKEEEAQIEEGALTEEGARTEEGVRIEEKGAQIEERALTEEFFSVLSGWFFMVWWILGVGSFVNCFFLNSLCSPVSNNYF